MRIVAILLLAVPLQDEKPKEQAPETVLLKYKFKPGDRERQAVDLTIGVDTSSGEGKARQAVELGKSTVSYLQKLDCKKADGGKYEITLASGDYVTKRELTAYGDKRLLTIKDESVKLESEKHGVLVDTDRRINAALGRRILEDMKPYQAPPTSTALVMDDRGYVTPDMNDTTGGIGSDVAYPLALPEKEVAVGETWVRRVRRTKFSSFTTEKPLKFAITYKLEKIGGEGDKREASISGTCDATIRDFETPIVWNDDRKGTMKMKQARLSFKFWNIFNVANGRLVSSTMDVTISLEGTFEDEEGASVRGKVKLTITGTVIPQR